MALAFVEPSSDSLSAGPLTLAKDIVFELSLLPRKGFPNEGNETVLDLDMYNGELTVLRKERLKTARSGYSVTRHIVAHPGYTFALPYFGNINPATGRPR